MSAASDKAGPSGIQNDSNSVEVLGSVTQESHSSDKCFPIQLRTSARVSKKLKLDSQNVTSTSPTERKGGFICLQEGFINLHVPITPFVLISEPKPEEKTAEQKSNTVRRVHELWSTEDKNAFFEALNEYGKDFDAIQTHMNNKRKKRGINHNIAKNRDQARHFYYRTWHKISKYLKFPQGMYCINFVNRPIVAKTKFLICCEIHLLAHQYEIMSLYFPLIVDKSTFTLYSSLTRLDCILGKL